VRTPLVLRRFLQYPLRRSLIVRSACSLFRTFRPLRVPHVPPASGSTRSAHSHSRAYPFGTSAVPPIPAPSLFNRAFSLFSVPHVPPASGSARSGRFGFRTFRPLRVPPASGSTRSARSHSRAYPFGTSAVPPIPAPSLINRAPSSPFPRPRTRTSRQFLSFPRGSSVPIGSLFGPGSSRAAAAAAAAAAARAAIAATPRSVLVPVSFVPFHAVPLCNRTSPSVSFLSLSARFLSVRLVIRPGFHKSGSGSSSSKSSNRGNAQVRTRTSPSVSFLSAWFLCTSLVLVIRPGFLKRRGAATAAAARAAIIYSGNKQQGKS